MTRPSDVRVRPARSAALVTSTETEPRRFGKQVVLGGVLDHLVERLGADHVHVVLVGTPDRERPDVPYRRQVVPKPHALAQTAGVLRWTVLPALTRGTALSLQEAVLRSTRVRDAIARVLDDIQADVEIWDTVRMGQYAAHVRGRPGARRILYADDLFSLRYTAMLENGELGGAAGQFGDLLPGAARRLLNNPGVQRSLLRAERALVAGSECRQPASFDCTLLVSDEESAVLRARLGDRPEAGRVRTLPPKLKPARTPLRPGGPRRRPEFTFIGGFGYAPNRQGLDWFLRTCREEVLGRLPEVKINVIGAGTDGGLPSAARWGSSVTFLGWVEDLDSVLARSVALLSPLRSGSGIKIKVLEALSRGLPVVATPAGVQGIIRPERPGETGFLVGEDARGLAEAMSAACDPATHSQLARAAQETWDRHYAPATVEAAYDEIFAVGKPAG